MNSWYELTEPWESSLIEIKVKPAVMARCKGKTTKEPGGLNGGQEFLKEENGSARKLRQPTLG